MTVIKVSEVRVKEAIKRRLKAAGFWHFFPIATGRGVSGVPDIVGCHKGRFFAIEAKATGGIVSPIQSKCINDLRNAGAIVLIIYPHNIADVDLLIEELK